MTTERGDDFDLGADELAEISGLLALGPSDVLDEQPAPSVWAGIEAALDATPQEPIVDGPMLKPPTSDRSVVDLVEARRKRRFLLALAAGAVAAAFLVAVPLVLALQDSSPDTVEVAASAELSAVPADFTGSGEAELVDGVLRVAAMGLDPLDDAVYELWLLEVVGGEPADMVSIGVLEADGTYALDESIDLDRLNVVDISIEPTDGDPTHSGNSVLRGQLEAR